MSVNFSDDLVCDDGTCKDHCGQKGVVSESAACFCDTFCLMYGDCCPDYNDECSTLAGSLNISQTQCFTTFKEEEDLLDVNVQMISMCPDVVNKTLVKLCRSHIGIPVYIEGALFANRQCAECNGQYDAFDAHNYVYQCGLYSKYALYIYQSQGYQKFNNFLQGNCLVKLILDQSLPVSEQRLECKNHYCTEYEASKYDCSIGLQSNRTISCHACKAYQKEGCSIQYPGIISIFSFMILFGESTQATSLQTQK